MSRHYSRAYVRRTLKDHSEWRSMVKRITDKVQDRWSTFVKFPIPPRDLYNMLHPKAVLDAFETIRVHCGTCMLNKNETLLLAFPSVSNRTMRINITLPEKMPLGTVYDWQADVQKFSWTDLPLDAQDAITKWIVQEKKYKKDHDEVAAALANVGEVAATFGQANRIWPNLANFATPYVRGLLQDKRKLSKYPDSCLILAPDADPNHPKFVLREPWRPERFAPLDLIIAESLVLPDDPPARVAWIGT